MQILTIFPFCMLLLFLVFLVATTESAALFDLHTPENRSRLYLDRRAAENSDNPSTFPTTEHHNHSGAFNVIHVTAAVIGIVAAAAVGITAFVVCRRRMQKRRRDPASTSIKAQHCPATPSCSKPRAVHVNLLAGNYYNENSDRIPPSSLSTPPEAYREMVSIPPPPPPYSP